LNCFNKTIPCSTTRMWRNGLGVKYTKMVHETVDESLDELGLKICQTDTRIIHIGFQNDVVNKQKALRVIEALRYEKQPYMWYYLGVAYTQIQDIDNAVDCFIKAIQSPMADNIKAHAYAILADTYRQSSLFYTDLAEEMLAGSLKLAPEQNLSHLIKAEMLKSTGKKSQAQKIYKQMMSRDTTKTQMHQDILLDTAQLRGMSNDCFQ